MEWISLGPNAIMYDGHILSCRSDEWGPSDAIDDYEDRKRKNIMRIINEEKKKDPYWQVVKERDTYQRLAEAHIALNKELEAELNELKEKLSKFETAQPPQEVDNA